MKRVSNREDPRPADLWFWSDWFASFDLKLCSLAAQGLWINMLGIMHGSQNKGTLSNNGKQITSLELSKIIGRDETEIIPLLIELRDRGVYSILSDGTIINRRMYGDAELSRVRAEAGALGGRPRKQTESKTKAKTESKPKAKDNIIWNKLNIDSLKSKAIKEVIDYLNDRTGKRFGTSKATTRFIEARLNEGRTLEDFKKVIDVKVAKWQGRTWTDNRTGELVSGDDYLRPQTLFCPTNFESYLNEGPPPRPAGIPNRDVGARDIGKEKEAGTLAKKYRAEWEAELAAAGGDVMKFPTLIEFARAKEKAAGKR